MNYLAHLYLAGPQPHPQALVGALMGDFVKGPVPTDYSHRLQQGIVLHRQIDAYTDAHPQVQRSRQRIRPDWRRYGGILVDMFYDHFLACRWQAYSTRPLPLFAAEVYRILTEHQPLLPERMQRSVTYMRDTDLLVSYRDITGIARALAGIERRLRRPSCLGQAAVELEQHYSGFGDDFAAFFPDLIAFVAQHESS